MRTPLLFLATTFTFSALAQLPGYVPTSGLVAWYPLSNSVVMDASGNGLNGTSTNTSPAMDRFSDPNGATDFTGISHVNVFTNPLFNTGAGMTVSAWVNLGDASENQKVMGRVNGSFNSGYILGIESGQLHPEVWNSAGEAHSFSAGTIPSNAWTQVAITWASNGFLVAYINGEAADSIATGSLPIGNNSEALIIGGSPWSVSPLYFPVQGTIDDIGIWDRALSPTEMMNVYNSIPTGISQVNEKTGLALYPNPAGSSVSITCAREMAGQRFQVMDAMGRKVAQGTLDNGLTTVGIEALPSGIYAVRIEGARTNVLRLVKQ